MKYLKFADANLFFFSFEVIQKNGIHDAKNVQNSLNNVSNVTQNVCSVRILYFQVLKRNRKRN